MKKMGNKGFTLVELLATIAILSLVIMITLYVAIDVIGNAKEKSYRVTINNIEKEAIDYLIENSNRLFYISSGDIEYQCITIQNLIDMDYFDNKILKSKVSNSETVNSSDYIYIERDKTTKSITKSKYINDASDINRLCDVAVIALGDIVFDVSPGSEAWAKEKTVEITYRLKNANNLNDYSYGYKILGTDEIVVDKNNKKEITVDDNVTIYAYILYDKDNEVIVDKQISISKIDNEKPTIDIVSTNNVDSKQTITVKFDDGEGSGLKEYYFGTVAPSSGSDWETIPMVDGKYQKSYQINEEITDSGTYYFVVKDGLGNQSDTKDITFYKTSFSVLNGTVNVSSVLTMDGNSFTLPDVSVNTGYTASGYWYSDTGYTQIIGQYGNSYIVSKNMTLYSKGNANIYTIKYLCGNGSGTAPASQTVKYNGSVAIASNTCTPPTGYSFSKWYDPTGDNNWTGWSGTWKYVNGRYGITSNTLTLTAQYTPNTYTIKFDGNGSTSGNTTSKSCTYDRNCILTSNGFSRSGYSFAGWATSASGSVVYTDGQSVSNLATSGTVTLYAQWKLDYTCYKITSSSGVACNSLPQPTSFGGTNIANIPKNYYVWGIADKMGYHSYYNEYWYYVDNYIRCEDDECSKRDLGCYIIEGGAEVMEDATYCEKGNKVSSSSGASCSCYSSVGTYCYDYHWEAGNVLCRAENAYEFDYEIGVEFSCQDGEWTRITCAK